MPKASCFHPNPLFWRYLLHFLFFDGQHIHFILKYSKTFILYFRGVMGLVYGQAWGNCALEKVFCMDSCAFYQHHSKLCAQLVAHSKLHNFAVFPIRLPHCKLNWWASLSLSLSIHTHTHTHTHVYVGR